jgi:hypothetical protein
VESHQTPEELIATTLAERFGANAPAGHGFRPAQDPLIQFMRERGHLVDPRTFPPPPQLPGLLAYGTSEWGRWVEEDEEESDETFEQMGINLADWVER